MSEKEDFLLFQIRQKEKLKGVSIVSVPSVCITFYSLFFAQGILVLDLHSFQGCSFSQAVCYGSLREISVRCKACTISTQDNTNT